MLINIRFTRYMPNIILSNVFDYQALLSSEFSAYLIEQKASEITRKNYLADIRHFFQWLLTSARELGIELREDEDKPLRPITSDHIENYKQSMRIGQTPVATVNRRLSSLRMFFQFAEAHNLIGTNPMMGVRNIPRSDAIKSSSTLDAILNKYASDTTVSPEDINNIKEFFSWHTSQDFS